MQGERALNILGVLILLIAIVLVGVGVRGLLTQNGRTIIAVPGVITEVSSEAEVTADVPTPTEAVPTAQPTQPIHLPSGTIPIAQTSAVGSAKMAEKSNFRIEVLSALYDVSGTPTQGCAVFDNKVPARRFTLKLVVVNETGVNFQPGEWGAAAYVGNILATLCLSGAGGLPVFAAGVHQPVTFVAFVNPDQSITSIGINTTKGASAHICFEEERVVACPLT